eukprot:scaffold295678_cov28-Tisochrysis_lutea.AAC.1
MKPKDGHGVVVGQAIDPVAHRAELAVWYRVVGGSGGSAFGRERERVREHAWAVEATQGNHEVAPVPVVRHAAAVIDLARDVEQCVPRDLLLLVEEHPQRFHRHFKIGAIKLVTDVPAERAELAPLLHDGVEEGHSKEELVPLARLGAFGPLLARMSS